MQIVEQPAPAKLAPQTHSTQMKPRASECVCVCAYVCACSKQSLRLLRHSVAPWALVVFVSRACAFATDLIPSKTKNALSRVQASHCAVCIVSVCTACACVHLFVSVCLRVCVVCICVSVCLSCAMPARHIAETHLNEAEHEHADAKVLVTPAFKLANVGNDDDDSNHSQADRRQLHQHTIETSVSSDALCQRFAAHGSRPTLI